MYTAYLNNNIFFKSDSTLDALALVSAELYKEVGTAGTFTFKIAPTNSVYSTIKNLADYVDVFRDDDLIFSGRVYSIDGEFNTVLTVTCEGLFAVLNDSVLRPAIFNESITDLITDFITQHNAQVGAEKQLTLGTINIPEKDNIIFRQYENHNTTMERLLDLQETYGGYMGVEKSNGDLLFNWTTITTNATQRVNFGDNLLDVEQSENAADLISVLVPLGAEVEQSDGTRRRINLLDVQEYAVLDQDYLEDADAIAEYGRVVGYQIWDDVTVPENLVQKGTDYLADVSTGTVSITVSAVDLAAIDTSIDAFEIGTRIFVHSDAHGLNQYFNCLSQDLNLLDPSGDILTLGTTQYGYIGRQNRKISKLEQTQDSIIANYALNTDVSATNAAVDDLTERVTQNSTAIDQNAQDITLRATTTDLNALSAQVAALQLASDNISVYFGDNGYISTWFTFDANSLTIGKTDAEYHTEQDNQSYSIVNSAGVVLFTVTPEGTKQETAEVEKQVKFSYGGAGQWAIREASYIPGVGVNLNDVWIGG